MDQVLIKKQGTIWEAMEGQQILRHTHKSRKVIVLCF